MVGSLTPEYHVRQRIIVAVLAMTAGPVLAQSRDTTTVVPGPHYRAGDLHQVLFGRHYRALWTEPLIVPYLDMDSVGRGLTPTTAGGGFQTKSLRFRGANGHRYGFRSVDKDPAVLPPALEGTFIEDLVRDQTSSAHPAAAGMVAPLLEAAHVLHTDRRLVVLPDIPALGEHRERFAGTLGYFEERAIVAEGGQAFAGATEILGSDELYPMVRASPAHRIDARQFLAARLIDLLIGDWDRHRGQWGWARFDDGPITMWVPIPEDRDQAFVRFDGLMLALARISLPQLVNFGDDYPNMVGLSWNGRESDRWFLAGLERPVFDSVATAVQSRITDSVIDDAIRRMPPEFQPVDGDRMRRALRRRRDDLGRAAREFYRVLAGEVDIHATDAAELISVERHEDGRVSVRIVERDGADPYFDRTFQPGETSELRIETHQGADRVVVRGPGKGIMIRVIGGGATTLVDSSTAGRRFRGAQVRYYPVAGDRLDGPAPVRVDGRPYHPPPKRYEEELPPRDWGHRWRGVLWGGSGPDIGVFFGGGAFVTRYGFRKLPYAYQLRWRGGWSTGASTFRADFTGRFHTVNSDIHGRVYARASGIEVLRFHGLGNETVRDQPDDFFRVNQQQYLLEPRLVFPLGRLQWSVGPTATVTRTELQPGRIMEALRPYGSDLEGRDEGFGTFGQLGLTGDIELDLRDIPANASTGVYFRVGGSVFPKLWSVESTFGELHGEVATYLSAGSATLRPTLALRAGAKRVWGTFPFHEAAFIGDAETVRLGRQNRYGGDAAAWGNAELRLRVARIFVLLPGHVGVFGIGDVGRVFLNGESSDTWHTGLGGGVWLSFLHPSNTMSFAVTRSDDARTALYVSAGFAY